MESDPSPKMTDVSDEATKKPYRLSSLRIVGLLGVFLIAIVSILAVDVIFSQLTQSSNDQLQNERARVLIGESIIQDIHRTELYVYQMAISSGNLAYKHYNHKIQQESELVQQKLEVLKIGGQVTRTIFLNIEEQDEIQQKILFKPQQEDKSYQLIELEVVPQLQQIMRKINELKVLLEQSTNINEPTEVLAHTQRLQQFVKHFPPLFFRMYENVGRLHYIAQRNTETLESHLAEQLAFYDQARYVLIAGIILFVLLFGVIFVRSVRSSNAQIDRTWQHMELAKAYAEQANRAKSQFLSNMSHELRTPLNAIIGFAQLLKMEGMAENHVQSVGHIHQSALHLLEMVNQILDLSKIEAGVLPIVNEPFSLHKLLDDTCNLLRPSVEEKGLGFHCDRALDVTNFVSGDELRIRQVLLNLLANAIKFTHVGSISLSVSITKEPNVVYFEIADTGIGMDEVALQKLFHAFTQADISTSKRYGGVGLGLSLSKELIELMGGSIGVHSVLNEGTRLWFSLTLPTATAVPSRYFYDQTISDQTQSFAVLRVLLVEDNPVNQMVAIKMLKRFGIKPDTAKHGQEALDRLAQADYDLVFLDVQMPVMDGYETIQRIRAEEQLSEQEQHLYVIGLSANALNEDKERAISLGMDDYLTKPMNFNELQQKLETALSMIYAIPHVICHTM